jgi:Zn-dependent protease
MMSAIRLFRLKGIDVFLHWSWFLVAAFEINDRQNAYASPVWNVFEYVAIFVMVLLHEFGHALACRQVGRKAERILLWPLGGVASVSPPQRPGATLWTIAAGPLVNVGLVFVLLGANAAGKGLNLWQTASNAHEFVHALSITNAVLL